MPFSIRGSPGKAFPVKNGTKTNQYLVRPEGIPVD